MQMDLSARDSMELVSRSKSSCSCTGEITCFCSVSTALLYQLDSTSAHHLFSSSVVLGDGACRPALLGLSCKHCRMLEVAFRLLPSASSS